MSTITDSLPKRIPGAALNQLYATGPLLTAEQLDAHYDDATLDYMHQVCGRIPWAVHIIGPDEIHTHVNPDLDDDDPGNAEFTMRTALKFAAESNAFVADLKVGDPPLVYHAVVFHNGERWYPSHSWDGPADAYCEWFDTQECDFFCNQCFRPLSGHNTPCPEHAPADIPGLQVTDCYAEAGVHPRTFVYADNAGYGAPCMYCAYDSISEAHRGCEHSHHGAWRAWRVTHRVVRRLHRLKLVTGSRSSYTSKCQGCISGISWRWSR